MSNDDALYLQLLDALEALVNVLGDTEHDPTDDEIEEARLAAVAALKAAGRRGEPAHVHEWIEKPGLLTAICRCGATKRIPMR